MSFGCGVTDVITVSTLAWKLYKTCKESSDDFKRVSTEIASLHIVLKETEEFLQDKDNGLTKTRQDRLCTLLETSNEVLKDLDRQLSTYESLGTHSQRTWDRLKWGSEDIAEVRSRMISVNTMFAAFNSSLANACQARVEKKLEKFIAEFRAGLREGSVVSSRSPQAVDDADSWAELQRELEDIGISAGMVSEHHDYIRSWFKEVIASGLLNETVDHQQAPLSDDDGANFGGGGASGISISTTSFPGNSERNLSEAGTLVNSTTNISSGSATPLDDSDLVKPSLVRARTTQDFDSLLTARDDVPQFPPPARSDTATSGSPTALLRKYSLPSLLLYRVIQKDTRLIDAASDGSLERVATLLSRGANINVRDRWGWTALSMAGYGGHEAIAKLLMACGAEIETTDVDGDSPYDLATNRGHTPVVIAIEEERIRRSTRDPRRTLMPGRQSRKGSRFGSSAAARAPSLSLGAVLENDSSHVTLDNSLESRSPSRPETSIDRLSSDGSQVESIGLGMAETGISGGDGRVLC
ncbi:MAG: hypothetical protein M1817_001869 [Caeruleum heppii]|nr:MAG: hypothetical protein M1817_001869 [Caeruleum heppii]